MEVIGGVLDCVQISVMSMGWALVLLQECVSVSYL